MLTFLRKSKLVTNDDGVISAKDIITDSAPGIADADFDRTLPNIATITQTYLLVIHYIRISTCMQYLLGTHSIQMYIVYVLNIIISTCTLQRTCKSI